MESLAARIEAALDRRHRLIAIILCAAWLAATMASSISKPFWHDEICTILVARLPSLDVIWRALGDGIDFSAPLNTLLTRGSHALFGIGRISTRLPALAGTALMIAVLFVFVRRRAGTSVAIAAVVLPSYTAAYRYAYEARGYGLMLGFVALALHAWAEAAAGRRRARHLPLMALSLGAAYWSHYFAIFALAPLCAGELVRLVRNRRADVALWGAAASSLLALIPLLGFLRASRLQAPRFWHHASLADIGETYAFVFHSLFEPWVIGGALLALGLATLVRVTQSRAPAPTPPATSTAASASAASTLQTPRRLPMHEAAAIGVCLLLPVIEVIAALLTSGVFVPRYALPLVIGASLAISLGLWRLGRTALGDVVFALLLTAASGYTVFHSVWRAPVPFVSPFGRRPLLAASLHDPRPVAVTGGLMFLQLWYYTPPALRGRLWYLADPDAAARHTGSDTIDRGLLALARWTPVNVADYASFVGKHAEFRVYAAGSGWLLDQWSIDGGVAEQIGAEPGARLLDVHGPRATPDAARTASRGARASDVAEVRDE